MRVFHILRLARKKEFRKFLKNYRRWLNAVVDSFTVDHTRMEAPAVRVAKTMNTPHGDAITVFDLRFCVPNKEVMPERGIHTGAPVCWFYA